MAINSGNDNSPTTSTFKPLIASDIYSQLVYAPNTGTLNCHWCGGFCERMWFHNEPPAIPFVRNPSRAKHPGNPYICRGCYNFQKRSITVKFFDGSLKDHQAPDTHSWWMDKNRATPIRVGIDNHDIYKLILKPPNQFVLSFLTQPTITNHLHCMEANDLLEIKVGTRLQFTIDNVLYYYSIYELEEALKNESVGKEPGVQALIRILGGYKTGGDVPAEKRERGRPIGSQTGGPDAKSLEKIVSKSGVQI